MKNRKLLLIVSLVLALTMSLGGTLAYLTDTDADINVMTVGKVEIVQNEQKRTEDGLDEFVSGLPVLPAVTTSSEDWAPNTPVEMDNGMWVNMWSDNVKNDIDKIVTVTNTGKSPAYVRTIVAVESVSDNDWHLSDMMAGYYANEADAKSKTNKIQTMVGNAWEDIGVVNIDGTDFYVLVATYKDPLAEGKTSAPSMTGVAMDDAVNSEQLAKYGDEWEIRVLSQAVQSDGFSDATTALDAGFGDVTAANVQTWMAKSKLEADIASPSDKEDGWPSNNPPVDGAVVVKTDTELLEAIQDPNVKTIAIDGNLTYNWGGKSYENSEALLMKGKTIVGVDDEASITFAGYGSANPIVDVTLSNITVKDVTVGDDEGAWEHGHLEFEGLKANNVVFADTIMLSGNSVLENCEMENNTSSWYGAWVEAGNVTFKNCTFAGTRAIKIHEAYGTEVASVVVDNCSFTLSEKPGVVIGTLDAGTSVTIKNSEFIGCQPGDQGKYIYETDSIKPALENNTVIKAITEIATADQLFAFANAVNVENKNFSGEYVVLTADIDLDNKLWTPIGQTGATEFKGVFDGQGHTISNLYVDSSEQTGGHYSSGLFGWIESSNHITIKNVNINGAKIIGHHNVAVIAGYLEGNAVVENCHVKGAALECTNANDDANGDKVGIIGGYAGGEVRIKNCSATNSSVSAGRDAGQIVGAAKTVCVEDCSATNVTVEANGTGTGANIREKVIGRIL